MRQRAAAPQAPLSAVDFMLLVVLLGADSYGYAMVKEMRERSGGQIDLLPGNLYSVLQRMERGGLIERSGRRSPGEGGPARAYYAITPLGREVAVAEAERMKRLVDTAEVRELIEEKVR
jgi:DNA-binding PadR family transcriptional regulator